MRALAGSAALTLLMLALAVDGAPPLAAQGRPSLREVLSRAGAYVVDYGDALSRVLADEEYVQELVTPGGEVLERRVLQAEIGFVPLGDGAEWQGLRQVLRVDGVAVPGADGGLERLFRDPPAWIVAQARRYAAESARYNLGPLVRTFNMPTMPLQFLQPVHQDRFRFDRQSEETVGGEQIWTVRFRDRGGASLIRSTTGRAVPVEGHFRINAGDGRVLSASFVATGFLPDEPGRPASHAEIAVEWRRDERLALWVPDVMQERYTGPWRDDDRSYAIAGTARYERYRRFEVETRVLEIVR